MKSRRNQESEFHRNQRKRAEKEEVVSMPKGIQIQRN